MTFTKLTPKTARFAFLSAIAIAAIVSVSQHAAAQLVIDDFSSGFYGTTLTKGTAGDTQTGTMAGGSRYTYLAVCDPTNPCSGDPFEQPNSYQVKKATKTTPNILIFNTGYKSDAWLSVVYGDNGNMNLALSPTYDRIRLYFNGADQFINFNLVVFTDGAFSGLGCNFNQPTGANTAFTVDLPFANFGGDADFGDITTMNFEFDASQGNATGEDWALTSIQAVLGGQADVTCGGSGS